MLHARWSSSLPSPQLPVVAQTVVASWVPGRYYFVSTIQLDTSSPLAKLTRTLQTGEKFGDVPDEVTGYITQVVRCNKHMVVKSFAHPLFEREYSTLSDAQAGHQTVVAQLESGRLRLRRLP